MKNKKKLIVLMLQIILIGAFVFTYKQYVEFSLQPTEVYGYARSLDGGMKITERDLIPVPLSQMTLNSNMVQVTDKNAVVGKYTRIPVVKHSIVYREQLGDITSVDKFASLDLSNSRVISLPIEYINGVAGDFKRGDRLDLMYSTSGATATSGEDSTSFTYAKIFMQNVPVYQVNTASGYKFTPHADKDLYAAPQEGEDATEAPTYEAIASISLIVTPEQAEQIEARKLSGNIVFVKRFEESETHETLGFVIGQYGKLFAGNANAETGNIQVSDAFLTVESPVNSDMNMNDVSFGTGDMEVD
jgi:pilus assembly protein CpaB